MAIQNIYKRPHRNIEKKRFRDHLMDNIAMIAMTN
jgi:hypothetical protein